jgi:hypothetical protein
MTAANSRAPVDLTRQFKVSPYFVLNAPYDYSQTNDGSNVPRQNTGRPIGPSAPPLPFNDGVNLGQVAGRLPLSL